jgi:Flp pilus assembly protein TadG
VGAWGGLRFRLLENRGVMMGYQSPEKNEKGQSIVELTLIAPLLLIALAIPADFGIAYFTANMTQVAAREAARIGASKTPFVASDVEGEATSRIPVTLTPNSGFPDAQLLTSGSVNCMKVVDVRITGTYNYSFYRLMGLIGIPVSSTLTITRNAQMRYEFQPVTNNTPCT